MKIFSKCIVSSILLFFSVAASADIYIGSPSKNVRNTLTPNTNKLDIDLKTGNDNLEPRDFQNNVDIRLVINGYPDIIKTDVNQSRSWANNSIHRITLALPARIAVEDLREISISRAFKGANNFDVAAADNWDLLWIAATATIKVNGVNKRFPFAKHVSGSGSTPLYRFVYENPKNENEGFEYKTGLTYVNPIPSASDNVARQAAPENATLHATFGTGGDNLEGGNNNVNLKIKFRSSNRVILLGNVNNKEKWNDNTEHTVSKLLVNSSTIDINDIKEVEVRHTGGGGIGADNWNLDKIYITISKNGESKVLVDRVGSPEHRFTGDTRIKTYIAP